MKVIEVDGYTSDSIQVSDESEIVFESEAVLSKVLKAGKLPEEIEEMHGRFIVFSTEDEYFNYVRRQEFEEAKNQLSEEEKRVLGLEE